MKLFHFKHSDYGAEFSVMANNKQDAIKFLLEFASRSSCKYTKGAVDYCISLDLVMELGEGEVLETEVS